MNDRQDQCIRRKINGCLAGPINHLMVENQTNNGWQTGRVHDKMKALSMDHALVDGWITDKQKTGLVHHGMLDEWMKIWMDAGLGGWMVDKWMVGWEVNQMVWTTGWRDGWGLIMGPNVDGCSSVQTGVLTEEQSLMKDG